VQQDDQGQTRQDQQFSTPPKAYGEQSLDAAIVHLRKDELSPFDSDSIEPWSLSGKRDDSTATNYQMSLPLPDSNPHQDTMSIENGSGTDIQNRSYRERHQGDPSSQPSDVDEWFLLSPSITQLTIPQLDPSTSPECSLHTIQGDLFDNQADKSRKKRTLAETEEHEKTLQSVGQPFIISQHNTTGNLPTVSTFKNSSTPDCACLKSVIFLIAELESKTNLEEGLNVGDLDSALDNHKEAIRYGEALRQCERCSIRSENMVLLGLLADRLIVVCEKIITTYLIANECLRPFGSKHLSFGDFKVDAKVEWSLLFGGLITLQLRSLMMLVENIGRKEGSSSAKLAARKLKIQYLHQQLVPYWPYKVFT
jgi:hypothetical protein